MDRGPATALLQIACSTFTVVSGMVRGFKEHVKQAVATSRETDLYSLIFSLTSCNIQSGNQTLNLNSQPMLQQHKISVSELSFSTKDSSSFNCKTHNSNVMSDRQPTSCSKYKTNELDGG